MQYKVIIKDGKVTIMHNKYTFEPEGHNSSDFQHIGHSVEIGDFTWKYTCHTCYKFWDETTAADYADEVDMYNAENGITGFYGDNGYNGFGPY